MSEQPFETPPPAATPSRALEKVLRDSFRTRAAAVVLLVGTVGTPIAGAEGNAYVNVELEGVELRVPRLAGAVVPAAGAPAYVLASRSFMLYVGTVQT